MNLYDRATGPKTWRNSGENLLGKGNVAQKGVLVRDEDSVELIAGLVNNLKGMVGEKWSEDEDAKMEEATEEVLNRQGDELCLDMEGEQAVKRVA